MKDTLMQSPDPLETPRLKIVMATIILNITAVMVFSFLPGSDWRTGVLLNGIDNAIFLFYAIRRRDFLMAHLMVFGLVVGFCELPADAWLVDTTKTLDYSVGGGPMIWRSPLWMPFAWEVVAVQFATLGLWFSKRIGFFGLLLTGIIGALNIPFYEEMALRIHWWMYHQCRMFSVTPYYIILGEFGIAVALAALARMVEKQQWVKTIFAGFLGGSGIFLCYAVAYYLVK